MNQSNSTIELSSSSQNEIRQCRVELYIMHGRDVSYLSNVALDFAKQEFWFKLLEELHENQIHTKLLLFRTIQMVENDNKMLTTSD